MALFSHVVEINRDDFKHFAQEQFGKGIAVGFSDFSDSAVIRFENMNQILVAFDWDPDCNCVMVEIQIKRKFTSLSPDRVIGGEYSDTVFNEWLQMAAEELKKLNKRGN